MAAVLQALASVPFKEADFRLLDTYRDLIADGNRYCDVTAITFGSDYAHRVTKDVWSKVRLEIVEHGPGNGWQ
jgi:hypothetical protein